MNQEFRSVLRIVTLIAVIATSVVSTTSAQRLPDDRGGAVQDPRTVAKALLSSLPAPSTDRDFYDDGAPAPEKVTLGQFLFYDKILSGNQNISCATCHHGLAVTGDGLALPVGEGGAGLGVTRTIGEGPDLIHERVPRNSPPVFNLGSREYVRMFHDGRVEMMPAHPTGFRSPAGEDLPMDLDNVLQVQAFFPITSAAEMAGQAGENLQADLAAAGDFRGLWEHVTSKIRAIPEYVELFQTVYGNDSVRPVTSAEDITYSHIADAMAAFENAAMRADGSRFDDFLRGDIYALSLRELRGAILFYGEAQCASCHSGTFQTDHGFHAIAVPQIGPGKGDGFDGHEDFGRERVTGAQGDRYRFRTPSLRNVAVTGPWGHAGAFDTLEAMIRHHLDPVGSLENYDMAQAHLPAAPHLEDADFVVHTDPTRRAAIAAANELAPMALTDGEVADLIAFLHALTDPASLDLRRTVPSRVPSGLPIAD